MNQEGLDLVSRRPPKLSRFKRQIPSFHSCETLRYSDCGASDLEGHERRIHHAVIPDYDELLDENLEPHYRLQLVRQRVGQDGFRALVTDAYTRRCAISGERTLPALEAAHIKPYAESGPNRTENGRDYYRFHGERLIVEPDNPAENQIRGTWNGTISTCTRVSAVNFPE
ncbi:MAG: HNH endonuclease [Wenzhouxiangellaceae bacterium]